MTSKILLIMCALTFLAACDGDDPFINFKPYREAPVLGKDDQKKGDIDEEEVADDR